jgi:hypothetical protein
MAGIALAFPQHAYPSSQLHLVVPLGRATHGRPHAGSAARRAPLLSLLLLEGDRGLTLVDTGFGLNDVRDPKPG